MNGGERTAGGEKKKRLSGRFLTFATLLFSLYLFTSNVNKRAKKKKKPEGLNVFLSENYFKGPMERLRDKRPVRLPADCTQRSQIPVVAQEHEAFLKCTFFIQLLRPTPVEEKEKNPLHFLYAKWLQGSMQQKVLRRKVSIRLLAEKKNISSISRVSFLLKKKKLKKEKLVHFLLLLSRLQDHRGPLLVGGAHRDRL